MEQIETTAHDIKTGYKKEVEITAEVAAGPASTSATTTQTTSLEYGNSRVAKDSKS
jgi:hypothetical protein